MSIASIVHELRVSGDPTEEKWADEIESLRAQLASARKALEGAQTWLSGWASAEPYLSEIEAALKDLR